MIRRTSQLLHSHGDHLVGVVPRETDNFGKMDVPKGTLAYHVLEGDVLWVDL